MALYYKMRQILLQNATAVLLQNATKVYYKMCQVIYYKLRRFYDKLRQYKPLTPGVHEIVIHI